MNHSGVDDSLKVKGGECCSKQYNSEMEHQKLAGWIGEPKKACKSLSTSLRCTCKNTFSMSAEKAKVLAEV